MIYEKNVKFINLVLLFDCKDFDIRISFFNYVTVLHVYASSFVQSINFSPD